MRKVTDEDRLNILIAYTAGEKAQSIAARYGISSSYPRILAHQARVRRKASEDDCRRAFAGFLKRTAPKAEPTVEPLETGPDLLTVSEIRRLASKGVPRTGIAALLRCNNRDVALALD